MAADTVQKIKEKLTIMDVVTPYVKLTKSGKYWRGLSPFTKEKTPSFFVNIDQNSYYCFSTSQGGDMFTFIEKMEGLDFKGALKVLAEKAGVEIVYEGGAAGAAARGEGDKKKERLRAAMTAAEATYVAHLKPGSAAREYALSRGLTEETIKDWNLGFAPAEWRTLLEGMGPNAATASNGAPFTNAELIAAGLVKEADGKPGTWYDRFRNRLMFPIRDTAGRTVAFTGRSLDPADQAKYLNSPETELFKKSEIFFGMDRAKDSIRTRGFALLVEGQFDLLLAHQIGFTNTIALSGTALSTQHIALIKRYADNLMLALDADRAGLASSAKSAHAALAAGMRVKAVRLPEGKDPADLAKEDPKEFTKRIKEAQSIVEFFLSVLASGTPDSYKLVQEVEKVVLPLIAVMPSPMEREHFVGITARAIGSTPEAIRAALGRVATESGTPMRHEEAGHSSAQGGGQGSGGGTFKKYSNQRPSAPPKIAGNIARTADILAVAASYPGTPLAEKLLSAYTRVTGAPVPSEPIDERALFEAGLSYGESPDETAADDLIRVFERTVLTARLAEASQKLRQAEAAQDADRINQLLAECKAISAQLSAFS